MAGNRPYIATDIPDAEMAAILRNNRGATEEHLLERRAVYAEAGFRAYQQLEDMTRARLDDPSMGDVGYVANLIRSARGALDPNHGSPMADEVNPGYRALDGSLTEQEAKTQFNTVARSAMLNVVGQYYAAHQDRPEMLETFMREMSIIGEDLWGPGNGTVKHPATRELTRAELGERAYQGVYRELGQALQEAGVYADKNCDGEFSKQEIAQALESNGRSSRPGGRQ